MTTDESFPLPFNTFMVIPSLPNSAYSDRIVVKTTKEHLEKRLNMLSMWGGDDKNMFGAPSWEMGPEEMAVAVKWCKRLGLVENEKIIKEKIYYIKGKIEKHEKELEDMQFELMKLLEEDKKGV